MVTARLGRLTLDSFYRMIGQCQAAIAEAVTVFGRIDVLFCCSSQGKLNVYVPTLSTTTSLSIVKYICADKTLQ